MRSKSSYLAKLVQFCVDKKSQLEGKVVHAHILRTGFITNTYLSNRLTEFYIKCGDTDLAFRVFDTMPQKDIYSWNTMLSAYCKASKLQDAHTLFVEMPGKDVVSWNIVISALVRSGLDEKALDVYYMMIREGFLPTRFTLASVLSACGAMMDLEHGSECHGLAIKIGIDRNIYVGNALLCMYAKCRCVKDAIQAFRGMPEPNEVSFTAMMGGLAESNRVEEALDVFRLMHRTGICIDSVSLSSILGVCKSGGNGEFGNPDRCGGFSSGVSFNATLKLCLHGQLVHGFAIKCGFESDLHLSNSLLDLYAKNGKMDDAEMIFANLPELSIISWNVMIAGYGQNYQSEKAIEYFQRMQCHGFGPDEVTCINMLTACSMSGNLEIGRQLFDRTLCPSLSLWNAILSEYYRNGNHEEAVQLFREMQFQCVRPDQTTLAVILSSCAAIGLLKAGKQVHAAAERAVFHTDIFVASGLIGMYSNCGKTEMAKHIFYGMPDLDIVCWNCMIAGFSRNSLDEEAFTFFKQMRAKDMFPTQFSYATVLSSCAKLSSLSQGRQIHSQIEKEGHADDVVVGSALIGLYSKCGDVDEARQFFDMMSNKNVVTWNQMINGYAQNGRARVAICLYEDMIGSGEKPDAITFVAILTACSHSGLIDTGVKIFNSMLDHGVELLLDHYICIIDCLGRAGRFLEVEMLIDKMPSKDDPTIWEVLLSSCRVHANVSLARRAAEELIRLNPQNSAPYVLLANIYASLGRWDDAGAVRELMNDKKVVKEPGYSWIDHNNEVQSFLRDDEFEAVSDGKFCFYG